ncbi:hypothetical protein D3C76_1737280 [compost metagenome]
MCVRTVSPNVCGIMDTASDVAVVFTTVKLMPSIVIDPLGIIYLNSDLRSGAISNTTAF